MQVFLGRLIFYFTYYKFYFLTGQRSSTFNMHQLLHLTENVTRNGPLWAYSCFYFEDYNGQLRRFFSGTQNVENQVNKKKGRKLKGKMDLQIIYLFVGGHFFWFLKDWEYHEIWFSAHRKFQLGWPFPYAG